MKLLVNGRIWQWGGAAPAPAHWMAVDDTSGMIHAVGVDPPPSLPGVVETVDLEGRLVLPGLHDAHLHAYFMGESAEFLDLTGCDSFKDFEDRLRQYDAKYPNKAWIVGFGWEQDRMSPGARYPTRQDIDAVVRDRPVVLHRACWHIAVVNTKALEIADIAKHTKQAFPRGSIDVDTEGHATGILREAAVELVTKHTNETNDAIRLAYLKNSLQKCVSSGLTAIHTNDTDAWSLYTQIQQSTGLPLRVYMTPNIDELNNPTTPRPGTTDGLMKCDRVKLFSDGSLGAETAAVRAPYKDTDNRGILMETDEELIKKVRQVNEAGYRLEIHAIGDRAAAQVLMALREAQVPPEKRPILTHCQILGDDLIDQMQKQGVIANIQPSFVITDAAIVRKRLQESVLPRSYCWKTLIDRGVTCAGGSDAPIETCNPFQGIFDAMFRHKPNDPASVFLQEEQLSFEQALRLYTINGAFAATEETRLGQLIPGFLADFVVLHKDVLKDSAALVAPNLVQSVWINGKRTYEYDGAPAANEYDFRESSLPGKNGRIRMCPCCHH